MDVRVIGPDSPGSTNAASLAETGTGHLVLVGAGGVSEDKVEWTDQDPWGQLPPCGRRLGVMCVWALINQLGAHTEMLPLRGLNHEC